MTSLESTTEQSVSTALASIALLRLELDAAAEDLKLWADGKSAYDHAQGLNRAADASRDIALAFTLLRVQAIEARGRAHGVGQ